GRRNDVDLLAHVIVVGPDLMIGPAGIPGRVAVVVLVIDVDMYEAGQRADLYPVGQGVAQVQAIVRQQLVLLLACAVVVQHEGLLARIVVLGMHRGSGRRAGQLVAREAHAWGDGATGIGRTRPGAKERVVGARIRLAGLATGVDEAVFDLSESLEVIGR